MWFCKVKSIVLGERIKEFKYIDFRLFFKWLKREILRNGFPVLTNLSSEETSEFQLAKWKKKKKIKEVSFLWLMWPNAFRVAKIFSFQ